jgi:hypothetical protein
MSRSGYSEDLDFNDLVMYRGQVASTIRGKRGQAFLREVAEALDAMPRKELIAGELVSADGQCCTLGAVCLKRNLNASGVDYDEPSSVAALFGITWQLAAEIEYENDEYWGGGDPAKRWEYMRKWVDRNLKADSRVVPPKSQSEAQTASKAERE